MADINFSENNVPARSINDEVVQKAYRFVAQSAAIAIQDAVDNLRNINAICTTVNGVAMAQLIENPAALAQLQAILTMCREMSANASEDFRRISEDAVTMLNSFPQGK